ncbi:N-acetylmuramoyl-L-alanine amidase [Solilutibacter silvestris]|uniref:N-acetylmuramoyl-L-alanine amidase n=1 Tax=Solilutibacter silvestris TaxID=1645665 RepID=UPI003D33C569
MSKIPTLLIASLALGLTACATQPPRNPIATFVKSPNVDDRKAQLIVVHYTEQGSVDESLQTLSDAKAAHPVSAHYLLGKDGHIYQLVPDGLRAWQAGAGRWGTMTELNSASIGIEIDNNGSEAFTEAQVQALLTLLGDLTTRLHIPKGNVIGHQDLAPTRKIDPGPLFPWKRLADAGYGQWPQGELVDPPTGFDGWMAMRVVGYDIRDRAAALRAFRMHYRARDDGKDLAPEFQPDDLKILYALTRSGS